MVNGGGSRESIDNSPALQALGAVPIIQVPRGTAEFFRPALRDLVGMRATIRPHAKARGLLARKVNTNTR